MSNSKVIISEIQRIMNELTIGKNPNKVEEIERIRKVFNKGTMNKLKTVKGCHEKGIIKCPHCNGKGGWESLGIFSSSLPYFNP